MAKNVKKAKAQSSKSASKSTAKPLKKQAKPAPAAKKKTPPVKAKAAPVSKKKEAPVKAAPKKAEPADKLKVKKAAAPTTAKAAKAGKADAKAKKSKRESEFEDDDLMVSDEDMGAEEIPDLAEFEEEEETAEPETETTEEVVLATTPAPSDDEAVLTDAEGRPYCKVKDCDQIAAVDSYCRYHYLFLWKKIQVRRKILVDGKLERYVEELTSRYPDKFLEMIRRDLRTEKDFLAAIAELEIDESGLDNDFEDESSQVLDEVRGFGGEASISDEEEF